MAMVWTRKSIEALLVPIEGGCRVFPRTRKDGWCRVFHEGSSREVAHLLWELTYGPIPDGHRLKRRCGNKTCANIHGSLHVYLEPFSGNYLASSHPYSVPTPEAAIERDAMLAVVAERIRTWEALRAEHPERFHERIRDSER